jgi:hypothetical protein
LRARLLAILSIGIVAATTVACSALVSLEDYTGGSSDASADANDATTNDGSTIDGSASVDSGADATPAATDATTADATDAGADSGPHAIITFVQVNADDGIGTVTVSLDQDVMAHDTILVAVDYFGTGALTSITDTLGNTYKAYGPFDATGLRQWLFAAYDVPAGTNAVTFVGDTDAGVEMYVHEYAGIAATNALDVSAFKSGPSDPSTDGVNSGFATTTTPGDLLFGFAVTGQVKAGTGFITRSTFNDNLTEERMALTPGSYQATATELNPSSRDAWNIVMAAFKPR